MECPKGAKLIPLTQGKFAIVDDEHFDYLNQWKWYVQWNTSNQSFYANRKSKTINGKRHTISMASEILGILGLECNDKHYPDHINHITLDNRSVNLRLCTASQNQHNRLPQAGASKFKGVYWHKKTHKWRARIHHKNKRINLGCFSNEIDAAKSYNKAAIKYFGKFSRLNNV